MLFIDIINKNYINNKMKQTIRLTESQLHDVIREAVGKILNEIGDTAKGQYMLGALQAKRQAEAEHYKEQQPQGGYDIQTHNRKAYNDKMQKANNAQNYAYRQNEKNNPYNDEDSHDENVKMYNANQRGFRNYMSQYYNHGEDYRNNIPQNR